MKHFLPFLILFCTSCHTVRQTTEKTSSAAHTDTVRLYEMHRDSVYLHDSVFTSLVVRGDTVYLTRNVTKYKCRVGLRVDTVYRSRTDTLRAVETREVTREAPVKLTRWQEFRLRWFAPCAALLLALLAWTLRRPVAGIVGKVIR